MRFGYALCTLLLMAGCTGPVFADTGDEPVTAQTRIATDDPYQAAFLIALDALQRRDYAAAIAIFEALYKKVPTARIRLELARACYLDRQYARARTLFQAILDAPELPWGVRENVQRYLDRIDESLGHISFSVAFISDSNPLNFTDHQQINIAGQTFNLVPPSNKDAAYGIQYSFNASRALSDDASLVGFLKVSFRDLEGGELDKWIIDAGIAAAPSEQPRLRGKLGLEQSIYGGRQLYRLPYASLTYIPDPVEQFRLSTEARVGYLDVEDFDYLDAHLQSIDLRAQKTLQSGSQLLGKLYLENAIAEQSAYSYRGAGAELDVSFPLFDSWGANGFASLGTRQYRAVDPFFGEQRDDVTQKIGLTLFNRSWKWQGMTPEFGLAYEQNQSNIDYYEYDKLTLVFSATRK